MDASPSDNHTQNQNCRHMSVGLIALNTEDIFQGLYGDVAFVRRIVVLKEMFRLFSILQAFYFCTEVS